MPPLRVADFIIASLADLGVEHIFVLPGGGAMYLNDALNKEQRVKAIACHHEQACGIAAEANGRSNKVGFGVALVTSGPGATNILTPVAGAWIESLPILVISGQVKKSDLLDGSGVRQKGVQEVDIVSMVETKTKYALTIRSPEEVCDAFEKAISNMLEGRPGPAWLDIPLDIQLADVAPFKKIASLKPRRDLGIPEHTGEWVVELRKLLNNAVRPVMLIGHGVRVSGPDKLFIETLESLGIPCLFTWNAADLMPADHPLNIGKPGVVAARAPNFALQNCDCLLSVGCRLDNIITGFNPKGFAPRAKKIIVDIDIHELAKHEMEVDLKIQMDARLFFDALQESGINPQDFELWRSRCTSWKARFHAMAGRRFPNDDTISHYQLSDLLSHVIPEDYFIATGSSGLAIEIFHMVFKNQSKQRLMLTSGLGAMGYGLPAAIGMCLGCGRSPTICIESDGSLMLNLQELGVIKSYNLPIIIIVMNNKGYASIRNTQRRYFEGQDIVGSTDPSKFFPDFGLIAASFGIEFLKFSTYSSLFADLSQVFMSKGPKFIEVILNPDEELEPKCSAIIKSDGSIVSMPLEDMSPLLPIEVLEREMMGNLSPQSLEARESD